MFLHETAQARFHATTLKPSNGKVLPPVRSSTLTGAILEVRDSFDNLRAESQALEWLHNGSTDPMFERLYRMQKWKVCM